MKLEFYRVEVILSNCHMKHLFCFGVIVLACTGCQSPAPYVPVTEVSPVKTPAGIPTPDGIVITPYDYPKIKRQQITIPK